MTSMSALLALCVLSAADSTMAARTIDAWGRLSIERLRLAVEPPPTIILVDRRCAHTFRAQGNGAFRFGSTRLGVVATEHRDSISLPGGGRIPLGGVAFTSLDEGGKPYFMAALPDVWANDPKYRDDPEDWAAFLPPVMLHELTHTRQLAAIAGAVAPHASALGLSAVDDDVLQRRFGADTAFASMVREEIDLLFRAASAAGAQRHDLARRALAVRSARRARYFVGGDSSYGPLETLFIDMEGAAQWVAYMHLRDDAVSRATPDSALSRARNNRKWWSQEYGLALYLLIDALNPNWPRAVFPPQMESAFDLLTQALHAP